MTDTDTPTAPNPFNADLARRTLAAIEANPDRWNQKHWIIETDCGTAFCFAGWAAALHNGTEPGHTDPIRGIAENALGLGGDHLTYAASALFHSANTLDDLRGIVNDYCEAPDLRHLEAAADRWLSDDDEWDDYAPDESEDW